MEFVVQPEHFRDGQWICYTGGLQKNVVEVIAAFFQQLLDRLHTDISSNTEIKRKEQKIGRCRCLRSDVNAMFYLTEQHKHPLRSSIQSSYG